MATVVKRWCSIFTNIWIMLTPHSILHIIYQIKYGEIWVWTDAQESLHLWKVVRRKSLSWALGCSSQQLAWMCIMKLYRWTMSSWGRASFHLWIRSAKYWEIHRYWPLANRICPCWQGIQGMTVLAGKICNNWGSSWGGKVRGAETEGWE